MPLIVAIVFSDVVVGGLGGGVCGWGGGAEGGGLDIIYFFTLETQ